MHLVTETHPGPVSPPVTHHPSRLLEQTQFEPPDTTRPVRDSGLLTSNASRCHPRPPCWFQSRFGKVGWALPPSPGADFVPARDQLAAQSPRTLWTPGKDPDTRAGLDPKAYGKCEPENPGSQRFPGLPAGRLAQPKRDLFSEASGKCSPERKSPRKPRPSEGSQHATRALPKGTLPNRSWSSGVC